MKMLNVFFVFAILTFSSLSMAQDQASSLNNEGGKPIHVSVNGLVCDFCARALEKVFSKQESVSDIHVDLDQKVVTINVKKDKNIDDKTITKLITDSGYNVEGIHRGR